MKKTKYSFSGHEKFECKIDWITKGLNAFSKNSNIFNLANIEEGIEILGLGINMIKSLRYWMQVLGLINELSLTKLGKTILDKDPYLENNDTLWLLHWNIVKNQEKATLYNLFFNNIYLTKFTKEQIFNKVISWMENKNIKLSQTTIKSDIDVLIKMYKNDDYKEMNLNIFSELKIIIEQTPGIYTLNINSASDISNDTFTYIFLDYIDMLNNSTSNSISMDDIQRGRLSLQKSLCLGENALYNKIYQLEQLTNGKLSFSEASGIRQIYINEPISKTEMLYKIYN